MSTTSAPALSLTAVRTDPFAHIGPNWFTTVMGTGIVATALATLVPAQGVPGVGAVAGGMWSLALLLLLTVGAATVVHWVRHPRTARGHLGDPVMAHAYGAPAMALLTVGAGALLAGEDLLGTRAAVAVDVALWTAGTALGVLTTVLVPWRVLRNPRRQPVTAAWLMPVVPPMVSAATGALLVPHLPGAAGRVLPVVCVALFALAAAASLVVLAALVARLARHGAGPAATAPTLLLVLGPLGQSVTAAGALATAAPWLVSPDVALAYGGPVEVLALLWAVLAAGVVFRAVRRGMPFTLSWWAFTFPVGTVVTGAGQLAVHSGSAALAAGAAAGWAVLLLAWGVVAVRTLRGVLDGTLLAPPR
ncbi:SLAC1 family transporter [Kineococcus sp. NUM-3379]